MKVLISLGKSFYEIFPDLGTWLKQAGLEVVEQVSSDQEPSKEVIKKLVSDVDIYIVGVDKIDHEVIDAAPKLKLIIKHGVGYDNIDLDYAKKKGIAVTFARGCNAQSVAELAVALMLSVSRGIPAKNEEIKHGGWSLFMGSELNGKQLGLVGYGNIGSRVAKIAQAFGMEVTAYDPYIESEVLEKAGIKKGSLEEVLSQSDFISLHAPATKENENLIRAETLQLMKSSAYLINTARGALVNEQDLKNAILEKRIAGAAMDVFCTEPPEKKLVCLEKIICTPHLGACTVDSARRLSDISYENVMNYVNNRPLKNRLV